MAQDKRRRGQNGPRETQRKAPPQNPYAPHGGGGGGRVPPLDAFDDVRRLPPPQNMGGEKQSARQGQRAPGAEKGAPARNRGAGNTKRAAPAQRAGTKNGATATGGAKNSGKKRAAPKKAKRKKRPVSPARRRRNRRIAWVLGLVLVIGLGVFFSVQVLFKIDTITVEGDSPYTEGEILAAFGREVGDNMFGFDAAGAEKSLQRSLPYLETVRVQRKLPGTVVLHVTPAVESYCIETDEGYAILSAGLKVLRVGEGRPDGLTQIFGLSSLSITPGLPLSLDEESAQREEAALQAAASATGEAAGSSSSAVADGPEDSSQTSEGADTSLPADAGPEDDEPQDTGGEGDEGGDGEGEPESEPEPEPEKTYEPDLANMNLTSPRQRWDTLMNLMQVLEDSEFEDITWISVADTYDLQFRWEGRITVKLGTETGINEKMAYVNVVLRDPEQSDIGENERGTLDASSYTTTAQGWFANE